MIVITGASGQLGRLVIEELKKSLPVSKIVAAVRSPAKVADLAQQGIDIRQADYTKPETLKSAFAGAEKILLISSSEIGQRIPQHKNIIDAAKQANISLLAYTSFLHASSSQISLAAEHKATEEYLVASGVPYVFLRNGPYNENYIGNVVTALEHGVFIGSAGDGRFSAATRADFAAAAASVLTQENHAGKIYELGGDEYFTLAGFAQEISTQSGKPVIYQNLPETAYVEALKDASVPEALAKILAQAEVCASKGDLFEGSKTLSKLVGRPTIPISETIKQTLANLRVGA